MTDEALPEPKGYTVKRRGVIGSARANFACNSKTCRTKKGARVYELPVAATRCSVCGSKRLQRLMDSVFVGGAKPTAPYDGRRTSSSVARRSDGLMEREYLNQARSRLTASERQQHKSPMFAVPMANLGATLSGYGVSPIAASAGIARPTTQTTDPVLGGLKGTGMVRIPTTIEKKWVPSNEDRAKAERRGR